jgi:hypothetical protein
MPGQGPAPRAPRTSGRHGPLLGRCRQLLIPEVFPCLSCLPDLGEVVPLELDVAEAGGVGHPGSDQLGSGRDHPDHEPASPIVPTRSTGSPRRSSSAVASQRTRPSSLRSRPGGHCRTRGATVPRRRGGRAQPAGRARQPGSRALHGRRRRSRLHTARRKSGARRMVPVRSSRAGCGYDSWGRGPGSG